MPDVPAACQALADRVSALEQQYTTLATQAQALTGQPAWVALGQLGALLEQLTGARADLAGCVKTHSAALTGSIVVMDASGGGAPASQTVTLWDLSGGGAVSREVAQVQGGAFGFQGPLPAQAALSVQTPGVADVVGLDFRSGSLPGPLDGQAPRVEIVLGPSVTIPAELLAGWAAAFAPVQQQMPAFSALNPTATPIDIAFGQVSAALSAGVVTVAGNGTISGGFLGGQIPWSASIALSLAPSSAPQTDDLISVSLAGANPVSVSIGGPAAFLGSVASLLAPFLGPLIQNELSTWANTAAADAIASGLALAHLPAGTRVSLRSLRIDASGVTFQPALGVIGTGLSTYQPVPIPAP